MSDCPKVIPYNQSRLKSLHQLTYLYSKIEYLQIAEKDFSTADLDELGLLAEYSINPVYSSNKIHDLHKRLSELYWKKFQSINTQKLSQVLQNKQLTVHIQSNLQKETTKRTQNNGQLKQIEEVENVQRTQEAFEQLEETEKLQKQIVCIQQIVSKNFNQIKQFILELDSTEIDPELDINCKILILNAWMSVPGKLQCFTPKKASNIKKGVQFSELQSINKSQLIKKNSKTSDSGRTIILGKNQSTQTKQMKHMLKVQAKTNFVQQKKKVQDQLNVLDKKSIQLNYLLNVITKEFFQDFSNDILLIVKENPDIISILCEKVIQKIKQQHNFVQIYVNLIRKLCKQPIQLKQGKNEQKMKFNAIQKNFVQILQKSFLKLISQQIQPSCSNFNQYKYQKQMMGISRFVGKLIRQKVLSKKIFKVCFWEIVYRYVQKVRQNPENEIVNQCLINAIVLISDSMGPVQLLKLIQKQRQYKPKKKLETIQQSELQTIQQSELQKTIYSLVNPNDQDSINRQRQCKNLVQTVSVQDYPHILIGIMQIFVSKRMKLRFLIQGWQQRLSKIRLPFIPQIEQQRQEQETEKIQVKQIQEDSIGIKKSISEYIKEMKVERNICEGVSKSLKSTDFLRHQGQISKFMKSQGTQATNKVFKLLVVEFFNQFADANNHCIIQTRIEYFLQFINSFYFKQPQRQLLEIICLHQFQNLMIIQCDYPFLVQSLCQIIIGIMDKLSLTKDDILKKIYNNFDSEDQDMVSFFEKVNNHFNKLNLGHVLQD